MQPMMARVTESHRLADDTIEKVGLLALQGSLSPQVKKLGDDISTTIIDQLRRQGRAADYKAIEIPKEIFRIAQKVIEYTPDPITGESITAPWVMAEKVWDHLNEGRPRPAGDCDDKTTFLAAMLLNRRFPVRIIAAWQSAITKQRTVNHVYPEVKIGDNWLPLEPSSKSLPFGKQSDDVKRIKIFWLSTDNGDNVIQ